MFKFLKDKKGVEDEFLFWMIFGLICLVVIVLVLGIFKGKGIGAIEFIKNLFRWG